MLNGKKAASINHVNIGRRICVQICTNVTLLVSCERYIMYHFDMFSKCLLSVVESVI